MSTFKAEYQHFLISISKYTFFSISLFGFLNLKKGSFSKTKKNHTRLKFLKIRKVEITRLNFLFSLILCANKTF